MTHEHEAERQQRRQEELQTLSPITEVLHRMAIPYALMEYGSRAYLGWKPNKSDWDGMLILDKTKNSGDLEESTEKLEKAFKQIPMPESSRITAINLQRLLNGEFDAIYIPTTPTWQTDIIITTKAALHRLFDFDNPPLEERLLMKNWPLDEKNSPLIKNGQFAWYFQRNTARGNSVSTQRSGYVAGLDMEAIDPGNARLPDGDFRFGFFYNRFMCSADDSILRDTGININEIRERLRKSTTEAILSSNNLYILDELGNKKGLKKEAYDVNLVLRTISASGKFGDWFKKYTENWYFRCLDNLNQQLKDEGNN